MSEHGVRGLYQGLGPNLLRASLVNVGELSAYDSAKQVRYYRMCSFTIECVLLQQNVFAYYRMCSRRMIVPNRCALACMYA